MTQLQFTKEDRPPRPLLLNSEHIGAVEPRRKLLPNQASQGMDLINVWTGAKITMAWGEWHNVLESYEDVKEQVYGPDLSNDRQYGLPDVSHAWRVGQDLIASNIPEDKQESALPSSDPVLESSESTSSLQSDAPAGGLQVEASPEEVSSTEVEVADPAQEQDQSKQEQKPAVKKAAAKKAAPKEGTDGEGSAAVSDSA